MWNYFPRLRTTTLRTLACAAALIAATSAGYCVYQRLRSTHGHASEETDLDDESEVAEGSHEELGVLEIAVPGWHVLPTEHVLETSPITEFGDVRQCFASMAMRSGIQLSGFSVPFNHEITVPVWHVLPPEPTHELSSITEFSWNERLNSAHLNSYFFSINSYGSQFEFVELRLYFFSTVTGSVAVAVLLQGYTQTIYILYADMQEWDGDFEESEEYFSPEEMEVPLISHHLAECDVTDVALKLCAIREAFSTVFACGLTQNLMYVAGKKILRHLTAANKQDVVVFQQAYDSLIRFLRGHSNQDWIKMELFEAQLHHLNFLDVLYELIVFRCFLCDSAPEIEFEGGFLEHLYVLISTWDITSWEPAAQQYFLLFIDHLIALLEDLFLQPLDLYGEPAALATVVRNLLKQHVQLMMETTRSISTTFHS